MAIPGQEQINIGAENQITGSDSLYEAFHAAQNNFTELFETSSPFNTFRAGSGVAVSANAANGVVDITNTGVIKLTAGSGVSLSSESGNVTISAVSEGSLGVTRVGLTSSTLDIAGGNIVSTGTFRVDLPSLPITDDFTAGDYISPNITVDRYGRITSIANATTLGTVTSVAVVAVGNGIAVADSPVTSNGTIQITNTGVTSLRPGSGIQLSGTTGDITISSTGGGASQVSNINIESSTLEVTSAPSADNKTFSIEIPDALMYSNVNVAAYTGNIQPNNIVASGYVSISGNIAAANAVLGNAVTANYFVGNGSLLTGITTPYGDSNVQTLLEAYTGDITANTITADDFVVQDSFTIQKTGQLFFEAQNGSTNYVSFIPPAAPSGQLVWTLPNTLGTSGNVLTSDAGVLGWRAPPSAGSNTQVQFADGTLLGGNANLTFNKTTGTLSARNITVANVTSNANISATTSVTSADIIASNAVTARSGAYVILNTQNDANTKFVALQGPSTVSGSYILWSLPNTAGAVGEYLTTNGSGQMTWKAPVTSSVPANASSTGTVGQIAYDSDYVYVCVATNTWKRSALTTW